METEPFGIATPQEGDDLGVDVEPPLTRSTLRPGASGFAANLPQLNQLCEGQVIAQKYFVDRVLGRDGMGVVAHVRHVELGRRYVFKVLPPEHCGYPEVVARFLRGARAAQALQSEHTARVLDAGRLEFGAPYAVSEFIRGAPLGEVLRTRGAVSVTEAIDFILQAAESIAEAHASRLTHKNLGLSKIFLTHRPDGSPLIKVADFGIAEALRADPLAAESIRDSLGLGYDVTPVGDTLRFAAPEQIRNPKDLDGRTDQYALGAILHELLSGFGLYQAESTAGLLAMIVADPATPIRAIRSDVPTGLEAVVLRCLEKDRAARFPTLGEFAAALKPYALPEARSAADRIVRTLGRGSHPRSSREALVHVGPAPSPLYGAGPRAPAEPPPLPSLPRPPRPIEPVHTRRPSAWVLGAAGIAAGALLTLVLTRPFTPSKITPGNSGDVDTAQLTLQRELVREIAALRAAREQRPGAESELGSDPRPPAPQQRRASPGRPRQSPESPKAASSKAAEPVATPESHDDGGTDTRQTQALKTSAAEADELFRGIH